VVHLAVYTVSFGEWFFLDCLTLNTKAQQSSEMSVSDITFPFVYKLHHLFLRISCVFFCTLHLLPLQ
jgi:hypothetical protein